MVVSEAEAIVPKSDLTNLRANSTSTEEHRPPLYQMVELKKDAKIARTSQAGGLQPKESITMK